MKLRALVVVGFVAALAAGCSGSSGGATPTPTAAKSSQPAQSPSVTADPAENGASDAGVDLSNPGTHIASTSATVGMSEDPRATLKVDVLSLKRKDKLLVLTVQVTPTNSLTDPKALFILLGNHFWDPRLIDSANLKEYQPVQGSSALQSSSTGVSAASGQPMYLYAVFAAPPAGVTSLNLIFADSVPTLNDVPIS